MFWDLLKKEMVYVFFLSQLSSPCPRKKTPQHSSEPRRVRDFTQEFTFHDHVKELLLCFYSDGDVVASIFTRGPPGLLPGLEDACGSRPQHPARSI